MLDLKKYLEDFINNLNVKLYNEFSFQHELGIYLRNKLTSLGYTVEFERPYTSLVYTADELKNDKERVAKEKAEAIKKEIDIYIFNDKEKYAVELKFQHNSQHPQAMFNFLKDIKFMQYLKYKKGFTKTYCVNIARDRHFYSIIGNEAKGSIYEYFRCDDVHDCKKCNAGDIIHNPLQKHSDEKIEFIKGFQIKWNDNINDNFIESDLKDKVKYYIIEN